MRTRSIVSLAATAVTSLLMSTVALAATPLVIASPDLSLASITCAIGGNIQYVDANTNRVTYWVDYTNSGNAKLSKNYTVKVATNTDVFVNVTGTATLQPGEGKIVQKNGLTVNTVTINPKITTKIGLSATISTKSCGSKELLPLKTRPANQIDAVSSGSAAINPGDVNISNNSSININGGLVNNAPFSCKVIGEATVKDNVLLMGTGISFSNMAFGTYPYRVSGYLQRTPGDARVYTGNYKVSSNHNGVVLNDGNGFRFELPLGANPETYVVTAQFNGINCPSLTFGVPAKSESAGTAVMNNNGGTLSNGAAVNGSSVSGNGTQTASGSAAAVNSGATAQGQVKILGQSAEEAETAATLRLAATASDSNATTGNATDENNMPTYLIYALLAATGGLIGYIVYLTTRRKTTV